MNKPGRNPAFSPAAFLYLGNHAASWSNKWGKNWARTGSETKEKPMSEWIPIADATIDKERGYYVTWRTGKVTYMHGHELRGAMLAEIAAIYPSVPTPEPYVPPAPPSPTHREWHFDGEPRAYTDGQPTLRTNAIVHAGPPVNGGLHVREVLPGDPTPEAIAQVVEEIRIYIDRTPFHPTQTALKRWRDILAPT